LAGPQGVAFLSSSNWCDQELLLPSLWTVDPPLQVALSEALWRVPPLLLCPGLSKPSMTSFALFQLLPSGGPRSHLFSSNIPAPERYNLGAHSSALRSCVPLAFDRRTSSLIRHWGFPILRFCFPARVFTDFVLLNISARSGTFPLTVRTRAARPRPWKFSANTVGDFFSQVGYLDFRL